MVEPPTENVTSGHWVTLALQAILVLTVLVVVLIVALVMIPVPALLLQ